METVWELLDRLEHLLSTRPSLWERRGLDEKEVRTLLQMIRARLPRELQEAQRMRAEAEQLLLRAQEEARGIVLRAQEHALRLSGEHEVVKLAQRQAEEILHAAQLAAEETRRGADAYARQVLDDLEQGVLRVLLSIRKGKQMLEDRKEK
ncbi:MAG: hypothetical protein N0A24_04235 [Armatimonadetes bacterium]|nr:hypothetical protein [Armatimonadota bacterium]MDW8153419.1 hypothetical protein [Armatimonadota bacterium]